MPGPLRRSRRLVAVLLLLLTPALGGWAVQTAHPCPTALASEQGHHGMPGHGGHGAECHCIGSCHAPASVALPSATVIAVVVAIPAPPPSPDGALPVPASRLSDLLPPSTAPPQG